MWSPWDHVSAGVWKLDIRDAGNNFRKEWSVGWILGFLEHFRVAITEGRLHKETIYWYVLKWNNFHLLHLINQRLPVSCHTVWWFLCWSCRRRDCTPWGGTRRRWWPPWAPPCWRAWCPRCWRTGPWSPCATDWSAGRPQTDTSPAQHVVYINDVSRAFIYSLLATAFIHRPSVSVTKSQASNIFMMCDVLLL